MNTSVGPEAKPLTLTVTVYCGVELGVQLTAGLVTLATVPLAVHSDPIRREREGSKSCLPV